MSDYIFIGNSTKPTTEKKNDRSPIKLDNVSKPCISAAIELGYNVVLGINRNNPSELTCVDFPIEMYDSHTYRSIFAFKDNYTAYRNLVNEIKKRDVETIHCNTPVGGLIGRLAGNRYRIHKIIYTAHGFHFYKGAPLINRTIFKWAEQSMAHWTDVIITMNQEDYEAAQKFNVRKGGKVYKVHGVGITLSEYENIQVNKKKKREELGLKDSDIICISAGDIVARKNYSVAIEAIAKANNPQLHYIVCGEGPERDALEKKANDLGISDKIHFLGFRTDVKELRAVSDIFLFSSLQEGLPRSLMEAMALGLPAVVSRIRGNVDLIEDGKGGILCETNNPDEYAAAIQRIASDRLLSKSMKKYNLETIKEYDISVVDEEIRRIYKEVLC